MKDEKETEKVLQTLPLKKEVFSNFPISLWNTIMLEIMIKIWARYRKIDV